MKSIYWSCVAFALNVFMAVNAQQNNLVINAFHQITLYIDGVLQTNLPNFNNSYRADVVALPSNEASPSIAVMVVNPFGGFSGLLASESNGNVVTDASWQCSNTYYANWFTNDFDASNWPAAVVYYNNCYAFSGVASNANWIWTANSDWATGDRTIYCKKIWPTSVAVNDLIITVDNNMTLYIDGVLQTTEVPNAYTWSLSDSVPLPVRELYPTIAVMGVNTAGPCGILASETNGSLITDGSWKCTNVYYPNWYSPSFDDSSWPAAYTQPSRGVNQNNWQGIGPAYWIWTNFTGDCYNNGDRTVYCRKTGPNADYPAAVPVANCTIQIRSYGVYGLAQNMLGWMVVNNVVVYNVTEATDNYVHRGYNTVLIDPTTCNVIPNSYNVYDTSCCAQNALDMSTYINFLRDGAIIAGGTNRGNYANILNAQPILRAMNANAYGMDDYSQFAFVSVTGYPEKTIAARNYNNGDNNNTVVLNVRMSGTVGNVILTQI